MHCVVASCSRVSPLFEKNLHLTQAVENLAVEEPITEPGIEALAGSVLPE